MTVLEYFNTDTMTLKAMAIQCHTLPDGSLAVELDRTIFHVQGGGQSSDIGQIDSARVLKVIRAEDKILHIVDHELPIGPVTLTVDENHRRLNSRLHSAGHLIGTVVEAYGWRALKGSHQLGQCRVVFARDDDSTPVPEKETIERDVNALVNKGLPLYIAEANGQRTVTWGDIKAYPCGGTHVQNTRELGTIVIEAVKLKKGELRVAYQLTDTIG